MSRLLKLFRLKRHQVAPVAPGLGGCIASDRIVVDGAPVGYMHRGAPVDELDSGWQFLAGDEDGAYMADLQRHGVYDVNTIVNYDPDILPFLDEPIGSTFQRASDGKLRAIDGG